MSEGRIRSFDKLFIGGQWVEPSTDRTIEVVSPIAEEVIATVPEATEAGMDKAVAAARKAFDEGPWPRMSPAERAEVLARVGKEVESRLPEMIEAFCRALHPSHRVRRPPRPPPRRPAPVRLQHARRRAGSGRRAD